MFFSLCFILLFIPCFVEAQYIYYSEYGAVGDGVTDDFDAIIRAHEAANESGMSVRADAGATYYIGGAGKTALIQTDTDWGNAKFIIDDINVESRNTHIFNISSRFQPERITTVASLKKNQEKLDLSLQHNSLIEVVDNTIRRFIRWGPDQNNGVSQTDVFVADKNGNVDMTAPIIWDFNNISSMMAYPIDTVTLTVRGGHFTTIANQSEPPYRYYSRGISITRSNVVIDGVYHDVTGEFEHSAPYSGFISASRCIELTVQNSTFTGRTYYSIGTYDLSVNRCINVTFRNCKQTNDINDRNYWGIFGSNYSKNLVFDTVEFSRFDAHMGVNNATIKNSVLGWMGLTIIGSGLLLLENTTVCGSYFLSLRQDYGSTWNGDIIIRNCEFVPRNGARSDAVLIGGTYSGEHDFGYTCYMPRRIIIDGLVINDVNHNERYTGPKIFAPFNVEYTSEEYTMMYPSVITEEVVIENITIKSGMPLTISENNFMFRNVRIIKK